MKVTVDADTCTGCELCVDTCPDVFEMADNLAKVKVETVPDAAADSCKDAASNCPVEAIKIEE